MGHKVRLERGSIERRIAKGESKTAIAESLGIGQGSLYRFLASDRDVHFVVLRDGPDDDTPGQLPFATQVAKANQALDTAGRPDVARSFAQLASTLVSSLPDMRSASVTVVTADGASITLEVADA